MCERREKELKGEEGRKSLVWMYRTTLSELIELVGVRLLLKGDK